ncbi:hypothetical protein [Frondihabitans cladoniiphilus]|uniref:DUF4878 domain-containing protein n=1 Tax=Frondihabitans cladoniiphilus TaxID=715785 RepID=A0ABP8VP59_9MICO
MHPPHAFDGHGADRASTVLLACFDHDHVARLAGVEPSGVLTVSPGPGRESVASWLDRRGTIEAGETVTLLVPLLRALLHLARRGLDARVDVVSTITFADIVLDDRGAPVVRRLSSPSPSSSAASCPAPSSAAPPWVGLESRARSVAARLTREALSRTQGGAPAARSALDTLVADSDVGSASEALEIDELIEVLLELAVPLPLASHGVEVQTDARQAAGQSTDERVGETVRGRLRASLAAVRPRVWLMAAVVAVSIVGGVVVLGRQGESGVAQTIASETPAPAGPRPLPSGPAPSGSSPAGSASPIPSSPSGSDDQGVLQGDDAAAATALLLQRRAACLTALDSECLAAVDQAGSPAETVDTAAVEAPGLLTQVPVDVAVGEETNRLGGGVLFRAITGNDEPASVLVIKTGAGWRLRDVRVLTNTG